MRSEDFMQKLPFKLYFQINLFSCAIQLRINYVAFSWKPHGFFEKGVRKFSFNGAAGWLWFFFNFDFRRGWL